MSRSVGVFEAKNQFSRIVQDAEEGRDTVITRHGRAVAKVTPAEPVFDHEQAKAAVEGLRALRERLRARGVRVTHEEIKAWINEGRP
jgi:prevent-host-death family protein